MVVGEVRGKAPWEWDKGFEGGDKISGGEGFRKALLWQNGITCIQKGGEGRGEYRWRRGG